MHNFAGMERILASKMNFFAENTDYAIYFSTYEQQNRSIPFPLNAGINYEPMNVMMPIRDNGTLILWLEKYIYARHIFRLQYKQILGKINPNIIVCTGYSFQVLDIIVNEACHKKIKVVVESHTKGDTVTFAYKYSYNTKLKTIFCRWDNHIMNSLKNVKCVITLTKYDVPFWSRYTNRVEVIPNMLTISPVFVKDYNAKYVISAGRYMAEKGFDRLIEAWKIVDKLKMNNVQSEGWQLYIYGNGDRTPYQKLVNKYGLEDTIHLEPAANHIEENFSESSIFVMSSRYEGFGLVLTEAMSCGLPCISFDCPYGPQEIINSGEDGILVDDGNIEKMAKAIIYLMTDYDLRKKIGRNAVNSIQRYNTKIIMAHWINLFKSL